MIRILVVDDHQLIRQGLSLSFGHEPDFEIVAEARTIAAAHSALLRLAPDVAIMDLNLPDGDGMTLVRQARATHPNLGIVVLTLRQTDQNVFDALAAGASAFITKGAPTDEIVAACRHAAIAPHTFVCAELADALQRRMSPDRVQLSAIEERILQLLKEGLSTAEIAGQIFVSASTTKSHIARIYEKLGAKNRAQALMEALRVGLIRQDNAQAPW